MKTFPLPRQALAWLLFFLAFSGVARAGDRPHGTVGPKPQDAAAPYPASDAFVDNMRSDPASWGPKLQALAAQPRLEPRLLVEIARAFVYAGDKMEQVIQAAQILGRIPFDAVDRSEWLYLCQKAAQRGADAMPCARRLLSEDAFAIHLLGGFDGLGKDYALVFILLQMPEQLWNREIGDRLWRGADSAGSQIAMLNALFYAVSLRDDAILSQYADDSTRPESGRTRARGLLAQMSSMERTATASPATLAQLRQAMELSAAPSEEALRESRRKALRQVSREGLLLLERYTFLIRAEALLRWTKPSASPR